MAEPPVVVAEVPGEVPALPEDLADEPVSPVSASPADDEPAVVPLADARAPDRAAVATWAVVPGISWARATPRSAHTPSEPDATSHPTLLERCRPTSPGARCGARPAPGGPPNAFDVMHRAKRRWLRASQELDLFFL
jgi:hypothetical protein